MGRPRRVDIDEKYHDAINFIGLFQMTRWDIRQSPFWEIDYILKRGEEEKIQNLKEYIDQVRQGKI